MTVTTEEMLTVDGVVLNTLAYNVSSLAGRLRVPKKRTENIAVPGRHGTIYTPRKFYEEGEIVLPLWVRNTDVDGLNPSRENFYANLDMLTKLFRKEEGLLEVVHTLPDGSTRRVMAEATEAFEPAMSGRDLADFSVALRVPAVFWEDEVEVSQQIDLPYEGGIAMLDGMTAPIDDAVFQVVGPVSNFRVETLYDGSPLSSALAFQYSTTIDTDHILYIDCGSWKLTGDGHIVNYAAFNHTGSARWLEILPGRDASPPELKFTGAGTGPGTQVTLTARRKYLVG